MKTRVWRQYKGSACGGSRLLIQNSCVAAATQLQDFRRRRKSCKLSEAVCRRRKTAACRQSGAAAKRRRTAYGFAEAGRTVQKKLVGFAGVRTERILMADSKKKRGLWLCPSPIPDEHRTGNTAGRRGGRRTIRPQKTFCGAEAAFCLRASASLLLGGQGTSRKFPPAAEILRSNAAIAALLLRPLRTRCIIPYCAGKTHTGRFPPAAAQTPSRGWAQPARERVRRDGRRGRKPSAARKSRHSPAFRCLFHPPPARNAQSDEKRS